MATPRAPRPRTTALQLVSAIALSLSLVGPTAEARPKVASQGSPAAATTGADWSPARASGPRDVFQAGDSVNAWATLAADAGPEWLRLTYERPLEIAELHIWQNDNPGAIVRVTADIDGEAVELWAGADRSKGAAPRALTIKPAKAYRAAQLTVHLDTRRVSGWNEIDAVEIVATDGSRHWAQSAEASTTYAAQMPVDRLAGYVGERVRVRADGVDIEGEVTAVDATWLTVRGAGRSHLVRRSAIAFISTAAR